MRILFVCLGNICRSPLAEGIFRRRVADAGLGDRIVIDSAGTGSWHVGEPPDERAQACAQTRGVDISRLRGRQFTSRDFSAFDRIVVMDSQNRRDVLRLAKDDADRQKVVMMLDYAGSGGADVPDPYFGGNSGFDTVFDLLEEAAGNLMAEIEGRLSRDAGA